MIRRTRILGNARLVLCLIYLLSACAVELDVTQTVPDSTGSQENKAHRATPEPATVAATSPELRPVVTLTDKTLEPKPTIIREEEKMTPTASVSPGLQKLIDLAAADLAQRLSIAADQVEVLEAKAVVWPDGGLGCPEPGVVYTQVRREGTLIRLRVGKRVYQYHSGGGRSPFLCEHPNASIDVPPAPGLDID